MKLLSHCVWLALAACGGSEPSAPAATTGEEEIQGTMFETAHQMCQPHGGLVTAEGRDRDGIVVALDITCLDGTHGRVSTPVKVAGTN